MTRSDITGTVYADESCVFFRNPKQSAFYRFRGAELVDLFVDDKLQFVYVFWKADHNRLKIEWQERIHD